MMYRYHLVCNRSWLPHFPNIRTIHLYSALCDESNTSNKNNSVDINNVQKSGKKTTPEQEETYKKLNDLLLHMHKLKELPKTIEKIKIPKPRVKAQKKALTMKKKIEEELKKAEDDKLENRLERAAKEVAHSMGGDAQKIEAELLDIYLAKRKTEDDSLKTDKSFSDPPSPKNLSDILSQMKVEPDSSAEFSRAQQIRSMIGEKYGKHPTGMNIRYSKMKPEERVNIFGSKPLNIFNAEEIKKKSVQPVNMPTWDYLYQRDLRLSVTHPPNNIFEQLIQWTEQGKLWKFPIDNEQGLDEEAKVDFSEHVFLEPLIDHWCPKTGPLRQFMHLVCVGLSKNPYYTIQEKKVHLSWYEHYFRHKSELLHQTGVEGPLEKNPGTSEQVEEAAQN